MLDIQNISLFILLFEFIFKLHLCDWSVSDYVHMSTGVCGGQRQGLPCS